MAGFLRVTPAQLGSLVPALQAMLEFVGDRDREAGDLFLGAALDVDVDEVHGTLSTLHRSVVPADKAGELSQDKLFEMLELHGPTVWARCALVVFSQAQPPVVGSAKTKELAAALSGAGSDSGKAVVSATAPALATMSLHARQALGELCLCIRRSSVDPEATALGLAGSVLLPDGAPAAERAQAKTVLTALVSHAEALFSSAERKQEGAAGGGPARPKAGSTSSVGGADSARRDALREFFEWRDKGQVELASQLFQNFEFCDIAKGVMTKYGVLPELFVSELAEMVAQGNSVGLEWFDKGKATPKSKRISLLPLINRKPAPKAATYKPTAVDFIIDEVVATEVTYHDTMQDLCDLYVDEIRDIADGKHGEEARKQLGLDSAEVETVFGQRLHNVLDLSSALLGKLDLVALVSTPPRSKVGRPGLMASIFSDFAPQLRVYAPYISTHMSAIKTLKRGLAKVERLEKLSASGSVSKLLGAGAKIEKPNFVNLWYKKSAESKYLKGHTLESILILPVQRVPRYKLLLETLEKEVPKIDKEHMAIPIIEVAKEDVMVAAKQINTAVKQHMKLESIFGKEEMINPNNAIVRTDAEGIYQGIMNSYV
jgi:hypothetical protein